MTDSVVLAEVVRSGFVEGRHWGSLVVLDGDGSIAAALGDPQSVVLPRSANKPMQAAAMVDAGLDVPAHLLALAAASHSGESFHLAGVREILSAAGLTDDALQTPPELPYGVATRAEWIRSGRPASRVAMNCSGKHAAMLATCVLRGWDVATYLDPDHPLQIAIARFISDVADEPLDVVGVDGCGAPLVGLSLIGLARAFHRHVVDDETDPTRRVADAMRNFPEWVGGTDRDVTDLMRGVHGLLAKDGAEAVYAAALPDGRSVALKIDDGGQRARPVVMASVLIRLGLRSPVLEQQSTEPLLGGGAVVGELRASAAVRAL